jgi:hypothetical protein
MGALGDVMEWARNQVVSRVPKADLDQRDPDYIRDQLPGTWLLASLYFRADVRGLNRIPAEGQVLLVGNHGYIADRIAVRQVGRTLAETLRCLKKLVESGDRIARGE